MDAATTARFNALLRGHHDDLVKQWTAAATSGLRGRLSEAELARQVRDLYGALAAPTPIVERVLEVSGLAEVFGTYGSVDEAKAARSGSATGRVVGDR